MVICIVGFGSEKGLEVELGPLRCHVRVSARVRVSVRVSDG